MTQQKAASPEEKLEEAAKAVGLHKIHEEEFFKNPGNSTEFDKLCNEIDDKGIPKSKAKELCIDLVHRLEKLSKENTRKQSDYCSYLRFWLYEKIGEIHTDKSGNIDNVPFFKHLIGAWKKMNSEKLKSKCAPEELKGVKLSELKNRIFSYIYFKNLEKIKTISTSKNKDDCTKYLTYLQSFKTLHDKYKYNHCESFFSWSWNGTDYFPCKDKQNLSSFISDLVKCKNGDTSDPKALPAGNVKGKGDSGPAPTGDKKGSEGAAGQKASAGPAGQKASAGQAGQKASEGSTSSSSSSTTVSTSTAGGTTKTTTVSSSVSTTTTTTASSAVTTTPKATVATTESGTKPVTTVTQAKTTSASTTTNTVTTTSSSSQGRSFLSILLGGGSRTSERASSLGASQTLSSSSRTLGSRTSGSLVTTTSTPIARGSISSTGQGGLTRPLAAAAVTEKSLSPQPQGSPGYGLQTVSSYNSNTGGDTNLASITDVPGTSETLYDKLDSNTVKNIVMAAAVLGIIFFLFYYNRSSRIESSIKPKKRKKKAFEHNYYEEYEKELARYESENESLDSLEDRYYLTYQPDQDSYY
ncbi:Plasmodium vivax Vir protein, putative [Plasmodium vivax]|uniref:Vir protein, putative n=1 Tax=Plasmodium vivax TaxID=5855 RepID=A0A1G4HC91_PLAVI|nr:Plasmodium vivax Vir protein, putative [Plasmodium vivax]